MKRIFSRMVLALGLIAALTFLFSGTASAQMAPTTHQTVTTVAAACPPTVSEGSTGSAVRTLQSALNELFNDTDDPSFYEMSPDTFHHPLTVDGDFGSQTLHAVIDFQTWNSPAFGGTLQVDGIIGPQSWHVLHKC